MTAPDIIDVEPSAEVAIGQRSIYLSTDAREQLEEARQRATVLVEVINEQGLSKSFGGGKPHVFVEGWQFLASQFGLIPEIEWTKELEDGWEARAALRRLSDGQVISNADAECRRAESNWKNRDSYAVRSMAQTRAVSKVCRIALSSVMVMAGFAATPAEEMDGIKDTGPESPEDPHCPACLKVNGELVGVWENDKKPFWKCKAKENCAEWNGKYAWSGWRSTFANSVADWAGEPIEGDPETVTVDIDRQARTGYIVHEIMGMAGIVGEGEAKGLVKPGLMAAITDGNVNAEAALGMEPSASLTDDELRVIVGNLTLAEADAVAAAGAQIYNERPME